MDDGEISEKREWRKLHVSVDQYNIIQTSKLTHRRTHDVAVVDPLMKPLPNNVSQVTNVMEGCFCNRNQAEKAIGRYKINKRCHL